MFTVRFLRDTLATRFTSRILGEALSTRSRWVPPQYASVTRSTPFFRATTGSQALHTYPSLSAPPQFNRQQYEEYQKYQQQQQQQQQQQYQQYQNEYGYDQHRARDAKPIFSVATLRSPSFRIIAIFSCTSAGIFYIANLEEVPVSGRRRFNCFSPASAEKQGEMAYRQIIEQEGQAGRILPQGDSRTRMVERVMGRLIEGGNLGTGTAGAEVGWEVKVIDDPGTKNAFVLPGGKVFVYTGILPICQNDSGLAAVLGHEVSHNLCGHAAERMSSMVMIQPLIWGLMYLDVVFTGTTSGLGTYLGSLLLDLGVMRPASRQQESEADHVGLLLMAQSCYDPKEAVGLWKRMMAAEHEAPPEWMSTHPSNENRIERLTALLPKAEEKSMESGCISTQRYSQDFKRALQDNFW